MMVMRNNNYRQVFCINKNAFRLYLLRMFKTKKSNVESSNSTPSHEVPHHDRAYTKMPDFDKPVSSETKTPNKSVLLVAGALAICAVFLLYRYYQRCCL